MPESQRIEQNRRLQTLGTLAAACIALGACRVPPPVYVVSQPPEALTVPGPPPPSVIEVPPSCPGEGYAWQEGYWNWEDDGYQWVEGDWVEERPGMALVDASYLVIDGIWTFQPPYWSPRRSLASASIAEGPGPVHRRRNRARREGGGKPPRAEAPHQVRAEAPPAQRLPPHVIRTEAPPAAGPTPDQGPNQVRAEAPPVAGPTSRQIRTGIPTMRSDVVLLVDEDDHTSSRCRGRCGKNLKKHPSYRGTRHGRPVFGDDPTSMEPRRGYRVDHTGAIILSSKRRGRRHRPRSGSLEVIRQDPTRHFRHRASEGGRPPRSVVVRPDPRPRPIPRQRINSSRGHRVRGSSAGIRPGDVSRSRSAMRQVSRTPPPVRTRRPARVTRSSSSQSPRTVRRPTARPSPRSSAPPPRKASPRSSSHRSTASSQRPSRGSSARGVQTRRRRGRSR